MRSIFFILSFLIIFLTSHAQNFEYSTITLKHIQFSGDTLKILQDGLSLGYEGYHWSDSSDEYIPKKTTAYVSNSAPRISAEFSQTCTTSPDSVYIKGIGVDTMLFPPIKVAVLPDGEQKKMSYPPTDCQTVFPNGIVQYFEAYDIDWLISYDGEQWMSVGRSETELFVVKNPPMPTKTNFNYWHTVYYLSCKNAHGLSDESEIIEVDFSEFEDQVVLNHKGDSLYYYKVLGTV